MYAAQWMLLERYISIKPAISRDGDIFSESETTDLLGAHSTDVEMDFLMHFEALLNRLMLLRFVKCGVRLICEGYGECLAKCHGAFEKSGVFLVIVSTHYC
ncbi:hypothetical protein CEXT_667441 [Caerostris extrusa]|uniref:Uncharacterized protein n=1 Tax=Caerostris extrusa TaxID=172846 RepID=A0AAV4RTQ5_CAEEX|nr:hypothetical protein CEXT_667441 [Caerostris extrusa]